MSREMQSAEEFVKEWIPTGRDERIKKIEARDKAIAVACAEAADKAWHIPKDRPRRLSDITNAILAVAKPPEDTRERLGRVLWEAFVANNKSPKLFCDWANLNKEAQEEERILAAAIQAELATIQEEADE